MNIKEPTYLKETPEKENLDIRGNSVQMLAYLRRCFYLNINLSVHVKVKMYLFTYKLN